MAAWAMAARSKNRSCSRESGPPPRTSRNTASWNEFTPPSLTGRARMLEIGSTID